MRKTTYMALLILLVAASGCRAKTPQKEVIARIGNYSLYKEDLLAELSFYPPDYRNKIPKEQLLQEIIQKKVLLLEAQREGLDKDPNFMKMVERFWEQSLLRSLLDKKSQEILDSIPQSEKDRNRKASGMMKAWISDLVKRTKIDIDREAFDRTVIK